MTAKLPQHDPQASLVSDGRNWALRLIRKFPQDPERIWEAMTTPDQLAQWTPFEPDRAMTTPGPITLTPTDVPEGETPDPQETEVLEVIPHTSVTFRWGEDDVRFSVFEDGTTGITHTLSDRNSAPSMAGGWHLCLGALQLLLDGKDVPNVVGENAMQFGWEDLRDAYAAQFDDAPAPTPMASLGDDPDHTA